MMKSKLIAPLLSFLLTGGSLALAGLSATSNSDDALDALYEVGKDLKSFTADVKLSETDQFAQSTWTRLGQVWYQRKPSGDTRLRVSFTKREHDGLVQNEWLEYKLDNGWLVDRNYARKLEVNRQVLRPGEKINLLKLGEGPFPLPIGQKREDVLKQFDVKKIDAAPTDPANTLHLTLTPRPGSQFERKFSTIDVWVSMQDNMPHRIETMDKNGMEDKTTDLEKILVNPDLNDGHFALSEIPAQDWQRRDEPYSEK